MPLRGYLFKRITIIGVGLMGGSIGLAVKKYKLAREVIGLSQKQTTLAMAQKMGAIDQGYHDVKKAVADADLVVLATPVSIIVGMLGMMGRQLRRHCVVTDVGSAKVAIIKAARESLAFPHLFVSSHPMAGSEKTGVQYASADLFQGTTCIMTPTNETNRTAVERIKRFWTVMGANIKTMSPEEHDKVMACISHLPHVLAYGLMETVPQEFLEFAAQGLKDTTRIASSSPQMWHDICLGNAKNIVPIIDEYVKNLAQLRKCIVTNDSKNLINHFKLAKSKRDQLVKPDVTEQD
jgi:prephenate dehydrogenase